MKFPGMFLLLGLLLSKPALAHFGVLIPSDDLIINGDPRQISLQIGFMHPFAGSRMDMAPPRRFGVVGNGVDIDLLPTL